MGVLRGEQQQLHILFFGDDLEASQVSLLGLSIWKIGSDVEMSFEPAAGQWAGGH